MLRAQIFVCAVVSTPNMRKDPLAVLDLINCCKLWQLQHSSQVSDHSEFHFTGLQILHIQIFYLTSELSHMWYFQHYCLWAFCFHPTWGWILWPFGFHLFLPVMRATMFIRNIRPVWISHTGFQISLLQFYYLTSELCHVQLLQLYSESFCSYRKTSFSQQ
jgi:hypothetical protein